MFEAKGLLVLLSCFFSRAAVALTIGVQSMLTETQSKNGVCS